MLTKQQYEMLKVMADSDHPLNPDAITKKLGAAVSTINRNLSFNKNNLNNMRLVRIATSEKYRTGMTTKTYILSIEGILAYLNLKNLRYERLKSFPMKLDKSNSNYNRQIRIFRNIESTIKGAMKNFAGFYDYPIFRYWVRIHDVFENDEDRDELYFKLMLFADYAMMLNPFYWLTLREYHTSDYRLEQLKHNRHLIDEFQLSFFNDMINEPFWMNKKSGIIKEALTEAVKDYEEILADRKMHIEKIKLAYGL